MRYFTLVCCLILAVSLAGCDKITQLKEYFVPGNKEAASPKGGEKAQMVRKMTAKPVGNKPAPENVLVQVGSWTMTADEFKERLKALKEIVPDYDISNTEANRLLLDELVRQELLIQEAERTGVAENKDIVNAVNEFRRTLLVREMATKISQSVSVTEEDAKAYYDQNPQDFTSPGEWRLREIVVASESEAKSILVDLYKGEGLSFEETARMESIAPSAENGGDLGYVSVFDFPKLENAVAALEVGDISNVIKGPQGYYIIKLEDKKGGEMQDFESIKGDIRQGLTIMSQQQAIMAFISDLESKTTIVINDKLLEE